MKYGLYCVKDAKTTYYSPRVEENDNAAVRWFASVVNAPGTMTNSFPEDFSLYKIGTFDNEKGIVLGMKETLFLTKANVVWKGDAHEKS